MIALTPEDIAVRLQGTGQWCEAYFEIPDLKLTLESPQGAARFLCSDKIFFSRVRYTMVRPRVLRDVRSFMVIVKEVNVPPTLEPIGDQVVGPNSTLTFTANASDPDMPAQRLRFSLDPGTPASASIDPITGQFLWTPRVPLDATTESTTRVVSWTPTNSEVVSTNRITVAVTDDGEPPLSDAKSFTIVVQKPDLSPSRMEHPVVEGGAFKVTVVTSAGWTYVLESKDSLFENDWTSRATVVGDGAMRTLVDSAVLRIHRFYRLRAE